MYLTLTGTGSINMNKQDKTLFPSLKHSQSSRGTWIHKPLTKTQYKPIFMEFFLKGIYIYIYNIKKQLLNSTAVCMEKKENYRKGKKSLFYC